MRGAVVKWDLDKYFGFIKTKDSKKYYFHGTAVLLPPGQTVALGDQVEFDLAPDHRRPGQPKAINVTVTSSADPGSFGGAAITASPRYLRSDAQPMPATSAVERRMAAEKLFRGR